MKFVINPTVVLLRYGENNNKNDINEIEKYSWTIESIINEFKATAKALQKCKIGIGEFKLIETKPPNHIGVDLVCTKEHNSNYKNQPNSTGFLSSEMSEVVKAPSLFFARNLIKRESALSYPPSFLFNMYNLDWNKHALLGSTWYSNRVKKLYENCGWDMNKPQSSSILHELFHVIGNFPFHLELEVNKKNVMGDFDFCSRTNEISLNIEKDTKKIRREDGTTEVVEIDGFTKEYFYYWKDGKIEKKQSVVNNQCFMLKLHGIKFGFLRKVKR